MGRLSQIFWFLEADAAPGPQEMAHHYSHLDVCDGLKKLGFKLRSERTRVRNADCKDAEGKAGGTGCAPFSRSIY